MSYRGNWNDGPVYVYSLTDPRNGHVFYIGASRNPRGRYSNHRHDPGSSAWSRFIDVMDAGQMPVLNVLSEHPSRWAALRREHDLIRSTPGLDNRSCAMPRAA